MHKNQTKQKAAERWLLAAVITPAAQIGATCTWQYALTVGIAAILIQLAAAGWSKKQNDVIRLVQMPILLCFLSWEAGLAAENWAAGQQWQIAVILVLLTGLSSWRGNETSCRAGAVIYWLELPTIALIILSGIRNVKVQWLFNTEVLQNEMLLPVLLFPMASEKKEASSGTTLKVTVTAALAALVVSVLCTGTLSFRVTAETANPLYLYDKSLSLFGRTVRLEGFAVLALTLGHFAAMSLAANQICEKAESIWKVRREEITPAVMILAIAMIDLWKKHESFLAIIALTGMGIIPIVRNVMHLKNMNKK